MRGRLALAVVFAAVVMCAAPQAVRADDDELPSGRIGAVIGARQGVGGLGNAFGMGGVIGIHAGYQKTSMQRRWSFGLEWSVVWAFFGPDDPAVSNQSLRALETSFGARARILMGPLVPRFVVLTTGATLLRTNVPVPPDMSREYVGPYLGAGVEQYLRGKYLFTFEARYGLLFNGPGSFTWLMSFSFGSY